MPSFSEVFGGGGIKSVQRGVSTQTSTGVELLVTISAVNPAKTKVSLLTSRYGVNATSGGEGRIQVRLVSATQLGIYGHVTDAATGTTYAIPVSWEVVEWY